MPASKLSVWAVNGKSVAMWHVFGPAGETSDRYAMKVNSEKAAEPWRVLPGMTATYFICASSLLCAPPLTCDAAC